MKSTKDASALPMERQESGAEATDSEGLSIRLLAGPARRAIARTRAWLLGRQSDEGAWCAELEGDTILESETILLLAWLGREQSDLAKRLARHVVNKQLPEGGWSMYPGGSLEISGSVKAYFALKLTGHDPSAEYMQRARRAILASGGADAVNSFTRFYLALLGQISYDQCPEVPPEAVLLPKWFPINLYMVSSWSRTIIVPLSIISAHRPRRQLEPRMGIRELFLREPEHWPPLRCPGLKRKTGLLSWDCFFRAVDRLLKWYRKKNFKQSLRQRAIDAAEAWMLERFRGSDGLGAIYPPIIWSIVALRCLGYSDDDPEVVYNHQQLADLVIDDPSGSSRVQPCKSPVWDTAITMRALAASGVGPQRRAMYRACRWLLDCQIDAPGDWSQTVAAEPGGWCFEYNNEFYPDSDDTAMVLMALKTQFAPPQAFETLPPEFHLHEGDEGADSEDRQVRLMTETSAAIDRGLKWLLAMQNDDGGWGAFDRNNNREFLCHVPFADHNAMIDPSTPDLAARVLECLGKLGHGLGHPAVDRGIAYLRKTQEPDGSWFGRWGVNYIYGTWQAITGLCASGVPADDPCVVAGVNWLLAHQQASGGWGESADSYEQPHLRGQGRPTASQTAWAVLGLLAAGRESHPAVARGIDFLTRTQEKDGSWNEPEFTGTGFPRVFYLRYHYYPIYFPLLAISEWAVKVEPLLAKDSPIRLAVLGD